MTQKAGFETINISLSPDGGNIFGIFRKKNNIISLTDLSQNYYRVTKAWKSHTNLKYLLSYYPYIRIFNKGIRILLENWETLFIQDGSTLLKKTFAKNPQQVYFENQKKWLLSRRKILVGSLTSFIFLILLFWSTHSLKDHSNEITAFIASHQDGNDLFVVVRHERLRNLVTSDTTIIINYIDESHKVLFDRDITKRDLHLIVEDDHLNHIQKIVGKTLLKPLLVISVRSNAYYLFTTESHYKTNVVSLK